MIFVSGLLLFAGCATKDTGCSVDFDERLGNLVIGKANYKIESNTVDVTNAISPLGKNDSAFQGEAERRLMELNRNNSNVQQIYSITDLPKSIRGYLGNTSDRGGPFSSGCSGNESHGRFLTATKTRTKYLVACEFGGVAHGWSVHEFDLDENGRVLSVSEIYSEDKRSRLRL
jgi:hypothetical protein